MTGQRRLGHAG